MSLSEALETYGTNPSLARSSVFEALGMSETHSIGEDLANLDALSEIEEFEEDYMNFAMCRGYDPCEAASAIDRRRDRVSEDERFDRDGSRSWIPSGDSDIANNEIKSMFGSLKGSG